MIVNSDKSLASCVQEITALYHEHKYLSITIRIGKDRSLEQNATWSAMYKRIDQALHWGFLHARAHCKWYHGIPILQRDFEGFQKSFYRIFGNFDESTCLKLMNANKLFPVDGFPVTRNFSTRQGTDYIDSIRQEFESQGVSFEGILHDEESRFIAAVR